MNKIIIFAVIILILIFFRKKESFGNVGFRMKILVPFYNPGTKLLDRCLRSIVNQTNKNYDVCLIDDASTKESHELKKIVLKYCHEYKNFDYIFKNENKGTLHSNVIAMEKMRPREHDVIIIVDGDDELYNNKVFQKIEDAYKNNDIYTTFGNYYERTGRNMKKNGNYDALCKRDFKKMLQTNTVRKNWYGFTHLKTFKYKLFKNIKKSDLMRNGKYLKSATDVATMVPIFEMAGGKFKCFDEPLYIYTKDHPNSHHNNKKSHNKQTNNKDHVYSKPYYTPIV